MTSRRNRVLLYLSTAQRKRMSHGTGYDLSPGINIILCEKIAAITLLCFIFFFFFLFFLKIFIFVLPRPFCVPVQKQFNVFALHQAVAIDRCTVVFLQVYQHVFIKRQTVQSFDVAHFHLT